MGRCDPVDSGQSAVCGAGNFAPKFLASLMLNDPTVISYTCIFLPLTGIALFPLGWLFVFRNACQGMGKTVLPMISGVVEVVMRVGIVQIAVPHFAFRGVAFAEISAWIARERC